MSDPQKTILLVEDEVVIGMNEAATLQAHGYTVLHVLSAGEAIRALDAHPGISLVLMDVDLGHGTDGIQAAQGILQEHDIPVLFLSSHAEKDIVERVERITSYGYVLKNSGDAVLLASMRMAFRLHEANRALRASEEKYSKAFHTSPDSININRLLDGVYVAINEGFTRLTGYTEADVLGKSSVSPELQIWDNPEDRQKLVDSLQSGSDVSNLVARFRRKDGSTLLGMMSAKCIDINGERCLLSVTRDISAQKQAEEALERKGELLRLFIEHAPAAIAMFDRNMRYLSASRRWFADLHLGDRKILGLSHYEVFPDVPERWKEIHRRCLAGAVEQCDEDPFPRSDGTVDWVRWEVHPWYEATGDIGGIIIFSEVLTERKLAQLAADRSRDEFERFFTLLPDLACIASTDGYFKRVNPAWADLLGYRQDELMSRPIADFIHRDDLQSTFREMATQIARHTTANFINRVRSSDGSYRWLHWRAIPTADEQFFYAVARDITARMQMEEQLRDSLREKDLLMKEVHHRVKNNLNVVASLLSMQSRYARVSEDVTLFEEARNRIIAIARIHERLYKSRSLTHVDFKSYIEDLVGTLARAFDSEGVTLEFQIEPLELNVDRAIALGIIVNELVTNSFKYAFPAHRPGKIAVIFRAHDADRFLLTVRDNGIGLSAMPDLANTSSLGLSIVQMLTEQLHGKWKVVQDEGTAIVIEIPREANHETR